MQYRFSTDGQRVVFADAFALTHVTLPKKAKSKADLIDPTRWCADEDLGWLVAKAATYGAKLVELPALASRKNLQDGGVCAVDGAWQGGELFQALQAGEGYTLIRTTPHTSGDVEGDWRRAPREVWRPGADAWEATPKLSLYPDGESGPNRRLCGDAIRDLRDGVMLIVRGMDALCVRLGADLQVTPLWRRFLQHPAAPQEATAHLHPDGVWIAAYDRAAGETRAVLVGLDGAERRFSFPGLALAANAGGVVVSQTGANTFARYRLSDPGTAEPIEIPEELVAPPAKYPIDDLPTLDQPAHPLPHDASNAQPGWLMTDGDQILFLPWHRETIVHLNAGRAIPRRLPRKVTRIRIYLLDRVARMQAMAAEVGCWIFVRKFTAARSKYGARELAYSIAVDTPARTNTLAAWTMRTHAARALCHDRLPEIDGYKPEGNVGVSYPGSMAPLTATHLGETFAWMARWGLSVFEASRAICEDLRYSDGGRLLGGEGGDRAPAGALLWAMLESIGGEASLTEGLAGWLAAPPDAAAVEQRLAGLGGWTPASSNDPKALAGMIWLVLGEDAAPILDAHPTLRAALESLGLS